MEYRHAVLDHDQILPQASQLRASQQDQILTRWEERSPRYGRLSSSPTLSGNLVLNEVYASDSCAPDIAGGGVKGKPSSPVHLRGQGHRG